MERAEALIRKREAVLERWFQAVVGTYPDETARFLRRQVDRFQNPVAHAVRSGLARLYDGLCSGSPAAELAPALDEIVRVRAVQEFSPSAAVAFVFAVKEIVREQCPDLPEAERAGFERAVDLVALQAFDVYMGCRETLFEIRVREIKDFQFVAARAGGCYPGPCGGGQSTAREGR